MRPCFPALMCPLGPRRCATPPRSRHLGLQGSPPRVGAAVRIRCRCHSSSRTSQQHIPSPGSTQRTHWYAAAAAAAGLHAGLEVPPSFGSLMMIIMLRGTCDSNGRLVGKAQDRLACWDVNTTTRPCTMFTCPTGVLAALLACGRCNIGVANKSGKLPSQV